MMKNVTIFTYEEMEEMRKLVETIKSDIIEYCPKQFYLLGFDHLAIDEINKLEKYLTDEYAEQKYDAIMSERLDKIAKEEEKRLWESN